MRKKTSKSLAVRHRSALTGRFVSKNYATKHRSTTGKEKIKLKMKFKMKSAKRKRGF